MPESQRLSDVFADTDTISYGPFKMIKKVGEPFKKAEIWVHDRLVPMQPAQKRILAMLISYQGEPVSFEIYAKEAGSPYMQSFHAALEKTQRHGEKRSMEENIMGNYRVQMHHIRDALANAFPDIEERKQVFLAIASTGPWRAGGEKDKSGEQTIGGYRLLDLK